MNTRRRLAAAMLLSGLLGFGLAPAVWAQDMPGGGNVTLHIDKASAALTAGDWLEFHTVLRNEGATTTAPLVAHLSIAAVRPGRYVDPEDWSPDRTRHLAPILPGASVQLTWQVHALVEGEFASFVTIVSPEISFVPVVSPALLLYVEPDDILPLNDVVPVVALVPIFPLALLLIRTLYVTRLRN